MKIETVSFLFFCLQINGKEQSTRGVGSVAPHISITERNEVEHMKLKYIVPNMAQTFGNLEFAGENDVEQQRVNGRFVPVTRSYNLYSEIRRPTKIIEGLPQKPGENHLKMGKKLN